MAYKKSKYSKEYNAEMRVALMEALCQAKESVTIDQLKCYNIKLVDMTTQKAARLLNEMVEMGLAVKGKNKASGKVTFKAVGVMIEQGYELGPERGYVYADLGLVG